VWPFKKVPTDPLEARLAKLERDVRDIRTDWDLIYDKFAMLLKRWAKRDKALLEGGDATPPARRDFITRRP